ncbi:hypothetical protein [Actinomadura violacea]|uniref:Uncharacterized protein n=1 Tax=Actinomadura violacea TaxID=2819934 RepID=A0ABS3RTB1_9ACTN|nr:hypothetical protein [Actinomadura violacea]MBO2459250.1 hypothetical protein [Actinomadura violacea]
MSAVKRTATDTMVAEAERLASRGDVIARLVKGHREHLDLASAGLVAEHLCECLDGVCAALVSLQARVQEITDREGIERMGRSTMALMEGAALSLDLGCDGLTVALHVLRTGRANLLKVENGDDL